jgi:hypothetical protein
MPNVNVKPIYFCSCDAWTDVKTETSSQKISPQTRFRRGFQSEREDRAGIICWRKNNESLRSSCIGPIYFEMDDACRGGFISEMRGDYSYH